MAEDFHGVEFGSDRGCKQAVYIKFCEWIDQEYSNGSDGRYRAHAMYRMAGLIACHRSHSAKAADHGHYGDGRGPWSKEFSLAQIEGALDMFGDNVWDYRPKHFCHTIQMVEELWRLAVEHDPDYTLGGFRSDDLPRKYAKLYDRLDNVNDPGVDPPKGYTAVKDTDVALAHVGKALAVGGGDVSISTGTRRSQRGDDTGVFAFIKDDDEDSVRGFLAAPLTGVDSDWSPDHSVWAYGAKNVGTTRKHARAWVSENYDTLAELQL